MQCSQKNFMRIIGNDQKNNGQIFWEILERIIGKISSIIGAALTREWWVYTIWVYTIVSFSLHGYYYGYDVGNDVNQHVLVRSSSILGATYHGLTGTINGIYS